MERMGKFRLLRSIKPSVVVTYVIFRFLVILALAHSIVEENYESAISRSPL